MILDLERRTAAARAEAGNWADPGDDVLVAEAITCLCKGKPPKRGSGTWRDMTNVLKPIHADWGLHDEEVGDALVIIRAAIALFLDEKQQMAVYKYPSFAANYGQYLSRAMNGDQKGDHHGNTYQRSRGRIAQGAVRREVASEEEARAILG